MLAAGALLGVSAGFEVWGMLGAPLLLLAPSLRRSFVGAVVQAAVFAAQLAPFALAGDFRMFQYDWHVTTGTMLSLLVEPGTEFGWPLRLLQASLALTCGAGIAFALRRSIHVVWLAPLAVVVVRLLLDPQAFGWYWLAAEALALCGAGLLLTELPRRFPGARLLRAPEQPRPATRRLPARS